MTNKVMFVCNMNSVRSPMAAALLRLNNLDDVSADSAGVYEGGLDPFVEIVMGELGVSLADHEAKALQDVNVEDCDIVIALTPEAAIEARRLSPKQSIEFWDVENPSEERGGRDAVIEAYRRVRDDLSTRIQRRFANFKKKP